MDHRVDPFEPVRVDPRLAEVPEDLPRASPPPDQGHHRVSSGGQERRQRASDEARGTRHRHALPWPVGVPCVSLQIAPQQLVAVAQHAYEPRPDQPGIAHGAHRAEWRAVVDPVGHDARRWPIGIEPMEVAPVCERSLHLLVHELPACLILGVARDPAEPDWRADPHNRPSAVGQAAAALDHLRMLPGRGQPLERARPLVPREHRIGGEGEPSDALENQGRC